MTDSPDTRPTGPTPLDSSITPMIAALSFGARLFSRAVTRVSVEGALDEIPREGPVIIAANHASNLDAVVLGSWLIPKIGRRFQWLGKKELFAWPVVGYIARHGGVHPVDRSKADVEAYRLAKRILDEGHVLFVFPEGTRSPDGLVHRFKAGSFLLALEAGLTIVPLSISGSRSVMRKGQLATRPGHVMFQVHEPVAAPRIDTPTIADARDLAVRIEQIVRSGVYTGHVSHER